MDSYIVPLMLFALADVAGGECLEALEDVDLEAGGFVLKPWKPILKNESERTVGAAAAAAPAEKEKKKDSWTEDVRVVGGIFGGAALVVLSSVAAIAWVFNSHRRRRFDGGGSDPFASFHKMPVNGSPSSQSGTGSSDGGSIDVDLYGSPEKLVDTVMAIISEAGLSLLDEHDVIADRSISQGTHGVVYAGRWRNSNTPVAVKVLQLFGVTTQEIMRGARAISNELSVLSAVRHPSIVHVYGVMVTTDPYTPGCAAVRIVMELAECSLQQLLTESRVSGVELSLRSRLCIAESVASGLSHLHSARRPVVHRDLKPANILVRRRGGGGGGGDGFLGGEDVSACIADFGVAKLNKTDITLVKPELETYLPEGTLAYMAPEIIDPHHSSSYEAHKVAERLDLKAADVYSMGCLLNELLTDQSKKTSTTNMNTTTTTLPTTTATTTPMIADDYNSTLVSVAAAADSAKTSAENTQTNTQVTTQEVTQRSAERSVPETFLNRLEKRLTEAPPSVDEMMESHILEGVPRRCVEIVYACLHILPEKRPSSEAVTVVFHEAYNEAAAAPPVNV